MLANVQNGFESRELDKMNLTPIAPGLLEQAQQEVQVDNGAGSAVQLHCPDCAAHARLAVVVSGSESARGGEFDGGVESVRGDGRARLCDSG